MVPMSSWFQIFRRIHSHWTIFDSFTVCDGVWKPLSGFSSSTLHWITSTASKENSWFRKSLQNWSYITWSLSLFHAPDRRIIMPVSPAASLFLMLFTNADRFYLAVYPAPNCWSPWTEALPLCVQADPLREKCAPNALNRCRTGLELNPLQTVIKQAFVAALLLCPSFALARSGCSYSSIPSPYTIL